MIADSARVEEVGGLHPDEIKPRLNFADHRLAAAEIMRIADDAAVQSDPAGGNVDVIPVTDRHIGFETHLRGPHIANLRPFFIA